MNTIQRLHALLKERDDFNAGKRNMIIGHALPDAAVAALPALLKMFDAATQLISECPAPTSGAICDLDDALAALRSLDAGGE